MPTYKLTATITHKAFDKAVVHEFYYTADSKSDVLDKIDTLPHHLENLDKHGRTAFKDVRGVKHHWKLTLMPDLN